MQAAKPCGKTLVPIATQKAERLIRQHKLNEVHDYLLEALIDELMKERDLRTERN